LNLPLQKEILLHIFKSLGIFVSDEQFRSGFIESLTSEKFLLAKKLAFETEDKEKHKNDIWSSFAKVGESTIKVIVADISDGCPEYAALVQMDNFSPYAVRLSLDNDDSGTISVNVGDTDWADANVLVQARLLSGIESLAELLVEWKKLDEFEPLYRKLIMFLNYQEENQ
jgi:hypothetical protein